MFIPAKDGARIPAFVVHRDDAVLDGSNPTLLYGYGGFNSGIAPFYVSTIGSFVNRGGIFVQAGIRGGDEYGDLMQMGVIDPAKVVRSALQNAASVAGLMLTTEALVAERPKEEKKAPPGGGHTHGDMDF